MNERWTRRRWMQTVLASGAGLSLGRLAFAQQPAAAGVSGTAGQVRTIELFNTHTNETLNVAYKRGTAFDPGALAALNNLLRDHRNGAIHPMDPALFDQLTDLARAARCKASFEIISGYRSPESNAKMSRPGSGVARKSLHMEGRAMDIRLRSCGCADLRDLALSAARGGVGYYQRSDFVHIDTGSFRTWVG